MTRNNPHPTGRRPRCDRGRCRALVLVAAALVVATADTPLALAAARQMFTRALARERALRVPSGETTPTVQQFRATIDAYEAIVRRYPRSSYSDKALWQGSGLALEAFARFGQDQDRQTGLRLLRALSRQYPTSSVAARADERARQFELVKKPVLVRDIQRTRLPDVVRITVLLDGEVPYHEERLENPARVFFDLQGTRVQPPLRDARLAFDDDIVREIRLGRHPNDTTRVVVDLEQVQSYSVFTLYNPYRLVIDCRRPDRVASRGGSAPSPALDTAGRATPPTSAAGGTREASRPPIPTAPSAPPDLPVSAVPTANSSGKLSLARQLGLGVSRIVLDPGHGGHDPGAQDDGLTEAALVLDVALRLEQRLLAVPHTEVLLTRRADLFVPLEERTAMANRVEADLFVSIHANANRSRSVRGIETYFLNFASDPEAEALAARENAAAGGTMRSLSTIVRAIALNTKLDESRDLAGTLQLAMVETLRPANPQVKDLGVKQAPFVVLIGAGMPSALVEISFVTNREEARLLKTETYRDRLADALLDGILRYQRSLKNAQTGALAETSGGS